MTIIRSLPASGKTTLTRARPDEFVDVDDIIKDVLDMKPSKATTDWLHTSPDAAAKVAKAITATEAAGKTVLSNMNTHFLTGRPVDVQVVYPRDGYIDHIKQVGRTDLLDNFSEEELADWAIPSDDPAIRIVTLKPGEFITDYVLDLDGAAK